MSIDWVHLIPALLTMIVAIDPIGAIPAYLFSVRNMPSRLHHNFAIRSVALAAFVLLIILVAGQFLIEILGLWIGAFQVVVGVLLFMYAVTKVLGKVDSVCIFGEMKHNTNGEGMFSLSMTSIASPGAMLAILLLTDNHTVSLADQAATAALLLLVLFMTLTVLLSANSIHRMIGKPGADVIGRVMGIALCHRRGGYCSKRI